MPHMEELLTAQEVAALLRISTMTAYRWGRDGTLQTVTIGSTIRFRKTSIDTLLAAPTTEPAA